VFGLGSIAALNDGYPWGPWKVLSVIVFTAYASGGYAVALLVYVMNRQRYHALTRTALLTSALGYTAAVITLGIDIGRPWNFWRLIVVTGWNLRSVLLEIAVCISTYIIFLWLEMAPPFLEQWKKSNVGPLKKFAGAATPLLERALPWTVAMAIVLPSMHQSSLGSLMLLAGPRLHPYWQTPLLPLLFLFSCWMLGYAFVIVASMLSSLAWRRPLLVRELRSLAHVMAWITLVGAVVRVADLVARGQYIVLPWTR
jgi:Ni/Fe-hydrogenase subunit HybB-like protein